MLRLNKIPSVLSFTSYDRNNDHNWSVIIYFYSLERYKDGYHSKAGLDRCPVVGLAFKGPKNAVGLWTDWRQEAIVSNN